MSQPMPFDAQKAVLDMAEAIFEASYPEIPKHKGCVFWASAMAQSLTTFGVQARLCAGSAQWLFRPLPPGDGPNAFSYVFDTKEAFAQLERGMLPEMHAWVILGTEHRDSSKVTIVDASSKYQPQQAKEMCGYDWHPDYMPPAWLWMTLPEMAKQEQVLYMPDMTATTMVRGFLQSYHLRKYGKSPIIY